MDHSLVDRSAERRELVRLMFGRTGSVRRWLFYTSLWLFTLLILGLYADWLGRIFILVLAGPLTLASYRARAFTEADHDEFRAWVRRERRLDPAGRRGEEPGSEDHGTDE